MTAILIMLQFMLLLRRPLSPQQQQQSQYFTGGMPSGDMTSPLRHHHHQQHNNNSNAGMTSDLSTSPGGAGPPFNLLHAPSDAVRGHRPAPSGATAPHDVITNGGSVRMRVLDLDSVLTPLPVTNQRAVDNAYSFV